jgi:hypothetical protein
VHAWLPVRRRLSSPDAPEFIFTSYDLDPFRVCLNNFRVPNDVFQSPLSPAIQQRETSNNRTHHHTSGIATVAQNRQQPISSAVSIPS